MQDSNEIKKSLLNVAAYFDNQSKCYASWGKVAVVQVALRCGNDYYTTNPDKSLFNQDLADLKLVQPASDDFLSLIFKKRKNINAILITKQEFASQVKEEIPPILDDQAQLLGVSIKIANHKDSIYSALKGRFAAILPNGLSICIGVNVEEAYVAAQLLEKTSKAYVVAKNIGGAKAINRIEAWLMQQFYLFKYSKEAKKNR